MSKKSILLAITNGFWLIQPEFAISAAGLIQKVLSGEKVFPDEDLNNSDELPVGHYTVSPNGSVSFGGFRDPFMNAAPGSTAVITISGPIMKYDNCGDPGTKTYSNLLALAKINNNINSVLLVIDSPGGTVDGTEELAAAVKSFTKPIVSFVDGLMASAAYWIGSGADELVANNKTAMIGSIGTMISFADMQPMYEKLGVKFHSIYADASKDKNKDFEEARAGNYTRLKAKLNTINDVFLQSVKSNRPGIKETALTGNTFLAEDAINEKLIDAIGDFDYALSRAQDRGLKTNNEKNQSNINMKKITLLASQAALLAVCGATVPTGATSVEVDLTDELQAKINDALTVGLKAKTDLATAATEITSLKTAATESETKITKLEADLEKAKSDLATEKTQHEALKKSNPGASGSQASGGENTGDSNKEFMTEVDQEKADLKKRGLL